MALFMAGLPATVLESVTFPDMVVVVAAVPPPEAGGDEEPPPLHAASNKAMTIEKKTDNKLFESLWLRFMTLPLLFWCDNNENQILQTNLNANAFDYF